jgi:aminoglycoside/choline kinase family phosphotransferase
VPRPDIDPEQTASNGRRECAFYATLAPAMPEVPTIRCYDAVYDEGAGGWHLLLEDLSETHQESAGYLPPPPPRCTDAVTTLARVHARWWQNPRLTNLQDQIGVLLDDERIARQSAIAAQAVVAFFDFLGEHARPGRRQLYERLVDVLPSLLRRLNRGPATLLHGDAHWRNFLYPRAASSVSATGSATASVTRIFDWQSCTVGPPAHDLAYMIPRHWHATPERELLDQLVRAYHATLLQNGVNGYPWAECWDDFRLAALRHAVAPATNWYRWGRSSRPGDPPPSPVQWATRLEGYLVAFDALECASLLATWTERET